MKSSKMNAYQNEYLACQLSKLSSVTCVCVFNRTLCTLFLRVIVPIGMIGIWSILIMHKSGHDSSSERKFGHDPVQEHKFAHDCTLSSLILSKIPLTFETENTKVNRQVHNLVSTLFKWQCKSCQEYSFLSIQSYEIFAEAQEPFFMTCCILNIDNRIQ